MRFIILSIIGIVLCVAVVGAITATFWYPPVRATSGTKVNLIDNCISGELRCSDNSVVRCWNRRWFTVKNCNEFETCDIRMGCVRAYRTSTEITQRDPRTCPRWRPYQKPVPGCG